jgi:large subunit ribosomal protein L19
MNMESIVDVKPNPHIPEITSGDTVRVSTRIVEGDKERIQVFQGVVIKIRNRGASSSFTVRRVAYGVGVERTFPIYSPRVEKVEIVRRGRKRRAKLYYLRGLSAKTSRLRERRMTQREMERENERIQKIEEAQAALKAEQEAAEAPEVEEEQEPVMEQETAVEEAPVAEPEAVEPEAVEEPAAVAEAEEEPVMEQQEAAEAVEEEIPEQEEKTA